MPDVKAATEPAITDFPEGMTWVAGGTGVAGPLDPVTGVHAEGTAPNERPCAVKVGVMPDGTAHIFAMLSGAPTIPMGSIHIPQDKIADVVAALQATPTAAEAA